MCIRDSAETLYELGEDVDVNMDEAEKLIIQNEGVFRDELMPLLNKTRNEMQYNVVSEFLDEATAKPGILNATFDVITPSTPSQIETETPSVDFAEPISPTPNKNMPNKIYSRNTQRKTIIAGFAKDNNLTPGSKRRLNDYFDTQLDSTNKMHKLDPRAEKYEEYSFGSYTRKYYTS